MAFYFSSGFDAAIGRLSSRNNGPYNPTTNPGGFDNEGHVVNFVPALADTAIVGQGLAAFAEYLNTSISPLIADAVASATTAAAGFAGTATTKAGEAAASAILAAAQANRLSGTSTTSNSIGTGARTFTTQADKFFGAGSTVTISSDSNPSGQQMNGVVTGYSGTTLTVNVQRTTGSGTYADWTIRVAGALGANGVNGWAPITANVVDGLRIVQRVVDWIGGSGEKPATGSYIGPNGLTPTISEATNVRGASGAGSGNVNPSGTVAANHLALFTDATGNGIKSGGLVATVATSGAYGDLSGTPAIPSVPGDIGAAEATALTAHTSATNNPHSVTKTQVGLGNVDNTSDVGKPVSTAQATRFTTVEGRVTTLESASASLTPSYAYALNLHFGA